VDDDILRRLRRFSTNYFPRFRKKFRQLVDHGQHPSVLFIGCSDSRVVPYLLMDCGPGELFIERNVGNLVPPHDAVSGYHGTGAAIEFAVLRLHVKHIVVCGHSHCGAIRALYDDRSPDTPHINRWLELARGAMLPVAPSEETLRRTEQRSIVFQLERLMAYPMVAEGVRAGRLFLHGWHYLIEDGRVLVLDLTSGTFVATDSATPDTPLDTLQ
jgi:carbonic anhydrase